MVENSRKREVTAKKKSREQPTPVAAGRKEPSAEGKLDMHSIFELERQKAPLGPMKQIPRTPRPKLRLYLADFAKEGGVNGECDCAEDSCFQIERRK